jgi:hypothetical protein
LKRLRHSVLLANRLSRSRRCAFVSADRRVPDSGNEGLLDRVHPSKLSDELVLLGFDAQSADRHLPPTPGLRTVSTMKLAPESSYADSYDDMCSGNSLAARMMARGLHPIRTQTFGARGLSPCPRSGRRDRPPSSPCATFVRELSCDRCQRGSPRHRKAPAGIRARCVFEVRDAAQLDYPDA